MPQSPFPPCEDGSMLLVALTEHEKIHTLSLLHAWYNTQAWKVLFLYAGSLLGIAMFSGCLYVCRKLHT